MKNRKSLIFENDAGERTDQFLSKNYPDYSRNYFQHLIENGDVLVNGLSTKPSSKLKRGDKIEVEFSEIPVAEDLKPADIKLDIIFENDDVIVINKQPGIVVHPAAGNQENTLVNALVNYFPGIKDAVYDEDSEVSRIRPGLVHRLDKDTSGVMIVAKNARAMHSLSRQIQNRNVIKKYLGLCFGWPKKESGTLTNYLGRHPKNRKLIAEIGERNGKVAVSKYKLIKSFEFHDEKLSLVEFDIKTGRTHQIRVQTKMMGNPIMGDSVYGNKLSLQLSNILKINRQMLHARSLEITLPGDNKPSIFEAPMPDDFQIIVSSIT
jgi:23S rRNA pseudouridine1911/1915/1917 synthase